MKIICKKYFTQRVLTITYLESHIVAVALDLSCCTIFNQSGYRKSAIVQVTVYTEGEGIMEINGKGINILNPSMPGKTVGSYMYIWGIAVFGYSYIVNEKKKQQPVLKNIWSSYIY